MAYYYPNPINTQKGEFEANKIKLAIHHNLPLEENLHVIAVISNVMNFKTRYRLFQEFMLRMESEPNVILYVVELCYPGQSFHITNADNPRHLQLKTDIPIWHKESMFNVGVRKLLPLDWRAVALIDGDIEMESAHWAMDTLKILNGFADMVQLFSHCVDMSKAKLAMDIHSGYGYQYEKHTPYRKSAGINGWHPGYAWAMTRHAFEFLGGMFEYNILGGADHNMALGFIKKNISSTGIKDLSYKTILKNYEDKIAQLRLSYVPGVIRHYFHGKKSNRGYMTRYQIAQKHHYSPVQHTLHNEDGLLVANPNTFSKEFQQDILRYFAGRNEDEEGD
jgi:hypothetical protein